MADLSSFEITQRWPAKNSDIIQLYSLATPNGIKVSAMLEETGLAYEAHKVDFGADEQHSPEFESLNPNGKIPAILDPDGPGGKPLGLFESGAILQYLAEKSGKLLSADPVIRIKTLQWVNFQMGGVGPMFGQFGHFYMFAKDACDHPYPLERYKNETQRLLGVLDDHLEDKDWISGDDYSIADIASWPWVACLGGFYKAAEFLELDDYENVNRWLKTCADRPASKKAVSIPA
ncbi:MAG: glutathione S-transferase N-terminal domain-containing protein [Rhizobiaceae bacterium]|nr:glutathione S-transferase N-terminal domain-containing protein [Rhizobiaceae bacterium]